MYLTKNITYKILFIFLLIKLLFLSSCDFRNKMDINDHIYDINNDINSEYKDNFKVNNDKDHKVKFWYRFNDDKLIDIINFSIDNNLDILNSNLELKKASILKSDLIKSNILDGEGKIKYDYNDKDGSSLSNYFNESYSLNFSWELDFFGKKFREYEILESDLKNKIYYKNAQILSISSEIAKNYFLILILKEKLRLNEENIKIYKELEEISQEKFKYGENSEIDFLFTKSERQLIEADIFAIKANIKNALYNISTLSGKEPNFYLDLFKDNEDNNEDKINIDFKNIIELSFKSSILENRPDILMAEEQININNSMIGYRRSDLFPSIDLSYIISSSNSYGLNINIPFFNIFTKLNQLEISKIEHKQSLLNYQNKINIALSEIEENMNNYFYNLKLREKINSSKNIIEKTYQISKLKYQLGEEDFIYILNSRKLLINVDMQILDNKYNLISNLIDLYKSFGGGL